MSFSAQELIDTKAELTAEIGRLLGSPTKPDVLLGNHPIVALASHRQRIAIWHGNRIEHHLANWIDRIYGWNAKVRQKVVIGNVAHEIDNVATNSSLGVVLAVEAKRIWNNQDSASKRDVKTKFKTYNAAQSHIISQSGIVGGGFRCFVFDVFGKQRKKANGVPVIVGDEIENIFSNLLWSYIIWERQVLENAILLVLELRSDPSAEQLLESKVLAKPTRGPTSRQQIFDYIDSHK